MCVKMQAVCQVDHLLTDQQEAVYKLFESTIQLNDFQPDKYKGKIRKSINKKQVNF